MNKGKQIVGGRPSKSDKVCHPVMVRFTDEEYARFLAMYEQSGVYAKVALYGSTFCRVMNEKLFDIRLLQLREYTTIRYLFSFRRFENAPACLQLSFK